MKSPTYTLAALALGLLSPLAVHAQSDGTSHGNGHDDRMARDQMLRTPCTAKVPAGSRAYVSVSGGSGNGTRSGGLIECNPALAPVSDTAYGPTRSGTISYGGLAADGKAEMNRIRDMGAGPGSGHYGN